VAHFNSLFSYITPLTEHQCVRPRRVAPRRGTVRRASCLGASWLGA